jgi:hypothetical protein
MASKKIIVFCFILTLLVMSLSGCAKATPTQDPSQKITEIASTVQAELTQISLLTPSVTPTLTPTVTETIAPATPTLETPLVVASATATIRPVVTNSTSDNSKWIADVTIPDGTVMTPSTAFVKTWTIQNTGGTTWTKEYQLMYLDGLKGVNDTMYVKLTKDVKPGEKIDVSVNFKAPAEIGSYVSWWKMYNASGFVFGEPLSAIFSVGTTPSPTGSITPTGSGTPSSGTVTPTVTPTP